MSDKKMRAIIALREVMQRAQNEGVIVAAIVGEEDDDSFRLLHTLATDDMCKRLLRIMGEDDEKRFIQ